MKQTLHTSRRAFKLALLCLMAFVTWGGNYCIAQETASLNFTKECGGKGTDDKGGAWTVTSDAKESIFDKDKGIHYGTGSAAVSYIKVSTSAYAEAVITKIVVNASTASGVKAKVKCEVGGAAFGVEKELTTSNASYTFEGNASGNILVSVYKPTKEVKALYIKSIEITYSTANLETTTLTLTAPDSPISIGGTYTSTPTLKAGEQTLSDKTITWSSDNENVATVEANTGVVTGIGVGTAKITAKFAGDDEYKQSTASYEIKVKGAPALSFPKESYDEIVGKTFEAPQLEGLPEGVTVQYTSSNDKVATVDPSTGDVTIVGVGTTTITATSEAKDIYEVATASYKLTVKPAIRKKVVIDFTTFNYENKTPVRTVSVDGVTLSFLANGGSQTMWYTNGNAVRFYGKNKLTINSVDKISSIEFVFGDNSIQNGNANVSQGVYDYRTNVWDLSNCSTNKENIVNKGKSAAYIQKIIVTTVAPASSVGTISIATPEGFGTYYNSNSYILPEGLTAFGYKEANTDGTLVKTDVFTAGDVVPANAALVVKGNTGKYECYATDKEATKTLEGNLLKGVTTDTRIEALSGVKRYILTRADDGILAFYRTNTGNINVKANRAYLEVPTAMAVASFSLEGTATGINNVVTTAAKQGIYTISGVRLNATTTKELPAGIYIVDGKKVIVK